MMIKEIIICLFILISLQPIYLSYKNDNNYEHHRYIQNYLFTQSKALATYRKHDFNDGIYFNGFANVNSAKTIIIDDHLVVIRLGNGSVRYE